ncbi:hypothetical protein [Duganella sp. Leaf126]|uniref:hypothetical protein n=1 Tax=Duganella sp. Leaf126 TaxID=1736266 RepID=UPI0012E27E75|nr:hypothetical protein [Duganella sp. Leaf126]
MNKHHLTARTAFNGGRFNKMLKRKAKFYPNKINDLQRRLTIPALFSSVAKKYFLARACGGYHSGQSGPEIFDKTARQA